MVPGVRMVEGFGGVEEEQVVSLAVVGEPEVPHPGFGESEHCCGQPFTPEEAMELMKDRWKATNSASTGTVIMVA